MMLHLDVVLKSYYLMFYGVYKNSNMQQYEYEQYEYKQTLRCICYNHFLQLFTKTLCSCLDPVPCFAISFSLLICCCIACLVSVYFHV